MSDDALQSFRENEFFRRVRPLLPDLLNAVHIVDQPRFGGQYRPDFLAILKDGSDAIIEIKGVTPNTQTRLSQVVEQLDTYRQAYQKAYPERKAKLALVVPGALSPEYIAYLHQHGIETVIDGNVLRRTIDLHVASDSDYFSVKEEEHVIRNESAHEAGGRSDISEVGALFLERLGKTNPGTPDWPHYQKFAGDILEFLFCPPLGKPRLEHATRDGRNRRDFILRNYAPHQFWGYMRTAYEAHYIVVDAKNSARKVRKADILQVANYLSSHGPGLFALIMSRDGNGVGAESAQREQWAFGRKMVVVVDDADVRQMITMRSSNDDPADLLAQKIEDFRLSF